MSKRSIAKTLRSAADVIEELESENQELRNYLAWSYSQIVGSPVGECPEAMKVRELIGEETASIVERNMHRCWDSAGMGWQGQVDMRIITPQGYWGGK